MLPICFLLLNNNSRAQEIPVDGPDVTGCGGFLVDSGLSAADYADNEDQTITLCAEAPETILTLSWSVSALGAGDIIEIYDGNSTAAALIGVYSGADLQNQEIISTNASGCLTIHFVSDGATTGNFAAEIACGIPCQQPLAAISSNELPPVLICPGESVSFDASSTQFFNGGAMASVSWDFDDGTTDNSSWPAVSHTFDQPGGYKVNVFVTDNNGCTNTNLVDFTVFVSTAPNFNLITDISDLCSGGEAFLGITNIAADSAYYNDSLNTWISNPWIDLPDNFNPDGIYVEDDQSACQDFYFTYNGFDANAVITSLNDIENIYMNFEHSFMQDLIITIICPNGQSVILHQQEGFGTNLGEPELDGPGVGYEYTWTPGASTGTWGFNGDNTTLPAGDYESVQPISNLIGCPLNGTWTLEFCDTWFGDDGYVFDYGVEFDQSFYGEILNFTPTYGPDCDSTYWTGQGISSSSEGCDYINVTLNAPGTYSYVYTAINNFGCSFDTTVYIVVDVAPTITAGDDIVLDCLNPEITLAGEFVNLQPSSCNQDGGNFNFTYDNDESFLWTFCPDPGFEESTAMTFTFISGQMEPFWERLIVYDGPDANSPVILDWSNGDATGLSWTATNASGCISIYFESDPFSSAADGDFQPWNYEVGCVQREPDFEWFWTPQANVSVPNAQEVDVVNLSQTTLFTLTAYPAGQPNCASSDDVLVEVNNDFSINIIDEHLACFEETVILDVSQINGGTAPVSIKWIDESGTQFPQDSLEVVATLLQQFTVIVEDACGISDTATTTVGIHEPIDASFTVDEYEGCDPTSILMTSNTLEFQLIDDMIWHFDDGDSTNILASANHEYTQDGIYYPWLEIIDNFGCRYVDSIDYPVRIYPTPIARFTVDEEIAILPNTTFRFVNNTYNGEQYLWTFDEFDTMSVEDTSFTFPANTEGTYDVELYAYNQYGCYDIAIVQVIVEEEIDLFIPNAFTPDYDGINDVWLFKGSGYDNFTFKTEIFNKWGEKIFETDDPTIAWTGNYGGGGNFVPDGVYFYKIHIRDSKNEVGHLYEGHITVVR